MRFWPVDGLKVVCPACECKHAVEIDTALNLNSGEKTEVAMLVSASHN
jgi:hypothetical protein